jgi:hypothetical protein
MKSILVHPRLPDHGERSDENSMGSQRHMTI